MQNTMSILKNTIWIFINNHRLAITLSCSTIIIIVLLASLIINKLFSKYILIAKKFIIR